MPADTKPTLTLTRENITSAVAILYQTHTTLPFIGDELSAVDLDDAVDLLFRLSIEPNSMVLLNITDDKEKILLCIALTVYATHLRKQENSMWVGLQTLAQEIVRSIDKKYDVQYYLIENENGSTLFDVCLPQLNMPMQIELKGFNGPSESPALACFEQVLSVTTQFEDAPNPRQLTDYWFKAIKLPSDPDSTNLPRIFRLFELTESLIIEQKKAVQQYEAKPLGVYEMLQNLRDVIRSIYVNPQSRHTFITAAKRNNQQGIVSFCLITIFFYLNNNAMGETSQQRGNPQHQFTPNVENLILDLLQEAAATDANIQCLSKSQSILYEAMIWSLKPEAESKRPANTPAILSLISTLLDKLPRRVSSFLLTQAPKVESIQLKNVSSTLSNILVAPETVSNQRTSPGGASPRATKTRLHQNTILMNTVARMVAIFYHQDVKDTNDAIIKDINKKLQYFFNPSMLDRTRSWHFLFILTEIARVGGDKPETLLNMPTHKWLGKLNALYVGALTNLLNDFCLMFSDALSNSNGAIVPVALKVWVAPYQTSMWSTLLSMYSGAEPRALSLLEAHVKEIESILALISAAAETSTDNITDLRQSLGRALLNAVARICRANAFGEQQDKELLTSMIKLSTFLHPSNVPDVNEQTIYLFGHLLTYNDNGVILNASAKMITAWLAKGVGQPDLLLTEGERGEPLLWTLLGILIQLEKQERHIPSNYLPFIELLLANTLSKAKDDHHPDPTSKEPSTQETQPLFEVNESTLTFLGELIAITLARKEASINTNLTQPLSNALSIILENIATHLPCPDLYSNEIVFTRTPGHLLMTTWLENPVSNIPAELLPLIEQAKAHFVAYLKNKDQGRWTLPLPEEKLDTQHYWLCWLSQASGLTFQTQRNKLTVTASRAVTQFMNHREFQRNLELRHDKLRELTANLDGFILEIGKGYRFQYTGRTRCQLGSLALTKNQVIDMNDLIAFDETTTPKPVVTESQDLKTDAVRQMHNIARRLLDDLGTFLPSNFAYEIQGPDTDGKSIMTLRFIAGNASDFIQIASPEFSFLLKPKEILEVLAEDIRRHSRLTVSIEDEPSSEPALQLTIVFSNNYFSVTKAKPTILTPDNIPKKLAQKYINAITKQLQLIILVYFIKKKAVVEPPNLAKPEEALQQGWADTASGYHFLLNLTNEALSNIVGIIEHFNTQWNNFRYSKPNRTYPKLSLTWSEEGLMLSRLPELNKRTPTPERLRREEQMELLNQLRR